MIKLARQRSMNDEKKNKEYTDKIKKEEADKKLKALQ